MYHPEGLRGPAPQGSHRQPETASFSAAYFSPPVGPYNVGRMPPHNTFFTHTGVGTLASPVLIDPPELPGPVPQERPRQPETASFSAPYISPLAGPYDVGCLPPHDTFFEGTGPGTSVLPALIAPPELDRKRKAVPNSLLGEFRSAPKAIRRSTRPKAPVQCPPGFFNVTLTGTTPFRVPENIAPEPRPKPVPVPMPVEMPNTYYGPPPAIPKPAPEPTPSEMSSVQEPKLCPEQAALVELITSGKNVFYTGSAGCGKSTVLRAFVARLRARGKIVRILAPTGRAALQVNGTTTWSYAGWTPNSHKMTLDELKAKAHGKIVWRRFDQTDVLVIDEISMVENLHFERLNQVMKDALWEPKSGHQQKPFGGVQVVVTGDFCQLPPVKPFQHCMECGKEIIEGSSVDGSVYRCPNPRHEEFRETDKWAFMSKAWQECDFTHVQLNTIHRQSDQTFIRLLQKCRIGDQLYPSEIDLLMNHECQVHHATKLYATRDEVNKVNQAAFDKLTGLKHSYWCRDTFVEKHLHLSWKGVRKGHGPMGQRPLEALNDHRFGERVEIKPGMLVVLLANIDLQSGLCNGSQGIVCGFESYAPQPDPMVKKAKAMPGEEQARKEQDGPRTYGDYSDLQEKEIRGFINGPGATFRKWPVVKFHNGIRRVIYAECSVTELGDEKPYSLLCRTQIPLAPAWAMTIHKSQSLTLDRVIVNLSKAFEKGQVYVALSRATSLNGLKIEGDAESLRKGLGGNREVERFLREKFGALNG